MYIIIHFLKCWVIFSILIWLWWTIFIVLSLHGNSLRSNWQLRCIKISERWFTSRHWNLENVFIQFNCEVDGSLRRLPFLFVYHNGFPSCLNGINVRRTKYSQKFTSWILYCTSYGCCQKFIAELSCKWLDEIHCFSDRDQISFLYVLHGWHYHTTKNWFYEWG